MTTSQEAQNLGRRLGDPLQRGAELAGLVLGSIPDPPLLRCNAEFVATADELVNGLMRPWLGGLRYLTVQPADTTAADE